MISKLQFGNQVIKSDNTRVSIPVIQRKYKAINTYKPKQESIRSDDRTNYQKQQDYKKGEILKKQYERDTRNKHGLNQLNGFITFISPSTWIGAATRNNKNSYIDNVATGEGFGNKTANFVADIIIPAIKARSVVSSIIKKNKINSFKSELDWSPESWFSVRNSYDKSDVKSLASHIPEYNEIERISKSNGTWLQMPDGSTWQGDPRSWVQLMSKDGQKLSKNVWWHGDTNKYTNASGKDISSTENGTRILWGSSKPSIARSYTNSDQKVFPIALAKNHNPLKTIDAQGRVWTTAYKKGNEYFNTNVFSFENLKDGEYLVINNVIDRGSQLIPTNSKYYIQPKHGETYIDYAKRTQVGDDIIIGSNAPRKYLIGNNGNFDLNSKDVFKVALPITGLSYVDN